MQNTYCHYHYLKRSPRLIHRPTRHTTALQRIRILLKKITKMQLGYDLKRLEERVAPICRCVLVFIKHFVGQRGGRDCPSLESLRPIQHDLQSVRKAGDLQFVDQGQVGRVVPDKLSKILSRKKGRPSFSACAISSV